MTRVDDPALRVAFQRRIAERFPNVSALDVSEVQRAVEGVLARAALAIRSMAIFSLATGAVVLVGAVATSRYQRAREAVLLKTLGATRAQVLRVALAEYASLGALAALAALALSTAAGWALTRFLFEQRFAWPLPSLL